MDAAGDLLLVDGAVEDERGGQAAESGCGLDSSPSTFALIANGYRWLAYLFIALFVLPLMTLGLWRVIRRTSLKPPEHVASKNGLLAESQ